MPKRLEAIERQFKALDLRIKQKMTLEEIAKQLGYSTRDGARKAIEGAIDKILARGAEEYRRHILVELAMYQRRCWAKVEEQGKDERAWMEMGLAIMDRIGKFTGAETPQEINVNVNQAKRITIIDAPFVPRMIEGANEPKQLTADIIEIQTETGETPQDTGTPNPPADTGNGDVSGHRGDGGTIPGNG